MDLVKFKCSIVECGKYLHLHWEARPGEFWRPTRFIWTKSPDAQLLAWLNSKPQPSFCQPSHQTSKSHRWIAFFSLNRSEQSLRTKKKIIACSIVKINSVHPLRTSKQETHNKAEHKTASLRSGKAKRFKVSWEQKHRQH